MNTRKCFENIPVVNFFAVARLLDERGYNGEELLSLMWPKGAGPRGGHTYTMYRGGIRTDSGKAAWDLVLHILGIEENARGTTRVIFLVCS